MSHEIEVPLQDTTVYRKDTTDRRTGDSWTQINIKVPLEKYEIINRMSQNTEGLPLAELSATDPRRAYKIAKLAIHRFASLRLAGVDIDKSVIATNVDATREELTMIGQTATADILPDEDTYEFNVTVGVLPSQLDIEMFGLEPDAFTPLAEMHVTPPDFAS